MTAKIKGITKHMERLNTVMKQVESATKQMNSAQQRTSNVISNANNTINRNTSIVNNNSSAVVSNITNINRYASANHNAVSSINSHNNALSGMKSTLLGMAGAYLSVNGLANGFNKFTQASDNYSNTNARLANINDGLQTQAQLQDKIFNASQRSLSSYNSTAASVAKLNLLAKDAFSSNDEAIRFTELMNKSFSVSGAGVQEMESGMYQLTQAMAAGKLQGDEFRSIMENAPMLAQAISKTAGVSMGELKKMSSEGTITADLIKKSLFNAADEIEEKFSKMPLTWAGAMTVIKNSSQRVFEPLFQQFSNFVNSDTFDVLENKALGFVKKFANGLGQVFNAAKVMYSAWQKVGSVVTSVAKVFGTFALIAGSILAVVGVVKLIGVAFTLMLSPIGLIAGAITGLIYGFKKLYDSSESFRNVINRTKDTVSELIATFKADGINGLLTQLLPPGEAKLLIGGLTKVSDFVKTFRQVMSGGLLTGILDRDKTAVALALGLAEGIKSAFSKVSDFIITFKQVMAGGLLTGILDRDQGAVAKAVALANGIKTAFSTIKDYLNEKVTQLQPTFEMLSVAFTNASNVVSTVLTTLWNIAGPIFSFLGNALQIIGDIAAIVFNNVIAPALLMTTTAASILWSVFGPILELLGAALQVVGAAVKLLWEVAFRPFFEYVTSGMLELGERVMPVLDGIAEVFGSIGSAISTAVGHVKDFASKIGNIKIPDWVTGLGGKAMEVVNKFKPDGSHYNGIGRIPKNNYAANLHLGEKVLTRFEADQYDAVMRSGDAVNKPAQAISNVVNFPTQQATASTVINEIASPTINNVIELPQQQAVASDVTNIFEPIINAITGASNNVINMPKMDAVASDVISVFRPIINAVAGAVDNVINVPQQQDAVPNVTYEQATAGITNNNTTANYSTVNNTQADGKSTQVPRSISIAKLAEQIVIREDADIDRITNGIVQKLIEAEAAGV